MIIEYTGRQFVVTEKYKARPGEALEADREDRHEGSQRPGDPDRGQVPQDRRGHPDLKGQNMVAVCEAAEMMTALRDALAKIEQQAVRQRQRPEPPSATPAAQASARQ